MSQLKGVIAPFTTPFKESGDIDLNLVPTQVDWLIANGVHGLAAGGSTGEGHALNRDEYRALMDEMIQTYRRGCAEARIDYALIDTATPFDTALSHYLVQRKKIV